MSTKKRAFLIIFYTFLPVLAYFEKSAKYRPQVINILINSENNTIFCAETARLNTKNTAEKPKKICIKFSYGLLKMLYIY